MRLLFGARPAVARAGFDHARLSRIELTVNPSRRKKR